MDQLEAVEALRQRFSDGHMTGEKLLPVGQFAAIYRRHVFLHGGDDARIVGVFVAGVLRVRCGDLIVGHDLVFMAFPPSLRATWLARGPRFFLRYRRSGPSFWRPRRRANPPS